MSAAGFQLVATGKAGATMTSREIAELTGKRHDNVMRVCDDLKASNVCPQIEVCFVINELANGRKIQECRLNKRDSLVLVARLSPEFTGRVVDRWLELEAATAPKLPQTYAQALRLAAEQAETIEAQAAQLESAKPAVAFVDSYVASATGSKGFREVCKLLKANETEFREFLLAKKIMYYLGRTLTPHAAHMDAGRFEVKAGTSGDHAFNQAKFTPKGVSWIAGEWAKHQIAA
jgi:phage antirepressor YoqD-like protein